MLLWCSWVLRIWVSHRLNYSVKSVLRRLPEKMAEEEDSKLTLSMDMTRWHPHECKSLRKRPRDWEKRLSTAKCREQATLKRQEGQECSQSYTFHRTVYKKEGFIRLEEWKGTVLHTKHPRLGTHTGKTNPHNICLEHERSQILRVLIISKAK